MTRTIDVHQHIVPDFFWRETNESANPSTASCLRVLARPCIELAARLVHLLLFSTYRGFTLAIRTSSKDTALMLEWFERFGYTADIAANPGAAEETRVGLLIQLARRQSSPGVTSFVRALIR
jgi:hypothetical protein